MSMTPSRRTLEKVTLADLVADNRMFVVRCALCRRQRAYLATDLVTVYPPETPAYGMFRWCSACGKGEWVQVSIRLPMAADVGRLLVRRPRQKVVTVWEDSWYG